MFTVTHNTPPAQARRIVIRYIKSLLDAVTTANKTCIVEGHYLYALVKKGGTPAPMKVHVHLLLKRYNALEYSEVLNEMSHAWKVLSKPLPELKAYFQLRWVGNKPLQEALDHIKAARMLTTNMHESKECICYL